MLFSLTTDMGSIVTWTSEKLLAKTHEYIDHYMSTGEELEPARCFEFAVQELRAVPFLIIPFGFDFEELDEDHDYEEVLSGMLPNGSYAERPKLIARWRDAYRLAIQAWHGKNGIVTITQSSMELLWDEIPKYAYR